MSASKKNPQRIAILVTAVALAVPGIAAGAAVDYFLKIDGIPGESKDDKHKDEIQIESFSWGISATTTAGGARAGKPCVASINFTKFLDKASPTLAMNVVTGLVSPKAILIGRKAGGDQQEYLKWDMKNVMVTSYQTGGSNVSLPMDQFSLNFTNVVYEYKPQDDKGALGPPVKASIDGGC